MLDPQKLRPRFVILISGQGSNMQAIVQACQSGACDADVAAVIASRAETAGLSWAAAQGIHTVGLAHTAYSNRDAFDAALAQTIDQFSPDYVLLAGFMRILTPGFVERFAGRLINIHPSLLPSFPGLHTHAQALAMGVQSHGCTVHFVTPVLDHGPIIAQGVEAVHGHDTPESLASRVRGMEHIIYPQVAGWLAQGRVHLTSDQRVLVDGVITRLFTPGQHL
jgi:phosphoribosylglycinamide formyltransferase-1